MVLINLTGRVFGKLTVTGRGPDAVRKSHPPRWYCQCSCGNPVAVLVEGADLRKSKDGTRTCGCGGEGVAGNKNKIHGLSKTGAYHSYLDMHRRCYDERSKDFKNYGSIGIKVCERWHRDNTEGLSNFISDMGERPLKGSLERKNFNAGYGPDNCCWLPHVLQSKNTRVVRWVEINGTHITMSDAARMLLVGPAYLAYHLDRGRSFEWVKNHVHTQRAAGCMSKSQEGWKYGRD